MIKFAASIALLITGITSCQADETVRTYGAADRIWLLQEINGVPFPTKATLMFPSKGKIEGSAPCNEYLGKMTAPYPWFDLEQIVYTKRMCNQMPLEKQFFTALKTMSLSEVSGSVLVLSTPEGGSMVFKASE